MKYSLLVMAMLCFHVAVLAQVREVSGHVTDKFKLPVEGVSVSIKDSDIQTVTNQDGFYKITTKEGENVLVFKN